MAGVVLKLRQSRRLIVVIIRDGVGVGGCRIEQSESDEQIGEKAPHADYID